MSTTSFDRPGTEVTQEFRNRTATILVPSMPSVILGPMKQVIEAVDDTGALVTDSRLSLPARIPFKWLTSPAPYAGLVGYVLSVRVNNAAAQSITFTGVADLTPAELVDQVTTAAIPGLTAVVEESGTQYRAVLLTTASGDNTSIEIGAATTDLLLPIIDVREGYKARGIAGYTNTESVHVDQSSYPDPRGIIDDVTIDYTTVRAFVANGAGGYVEAKTTEGYIGGATSDVTITDDGDGDSLTPYLNFADANFANAVLRGKVSWTTALASFGTNTLVLLLNGVTTVTTTFATPVSAAVAAGAVNTALGANGTCVLGAGDIPIITTTSTGVGATIEVLAAGTVDATAIGIPEGTKVGGPGYVARAQGTVVLSSLGANPASIVGRVLRMAIDDDQYQTLTFPATLADETAILAAITGVWGSAATLSADNRLVLTGTRNGSEGQIRIDKTTSDATLLLTGLGLTTAVVGPFVSTDTVFGTAHTPVVGDSVYVDGLAVGEITEVPSSPVNRLRMSTEQLLTYLGYSWKIVAKGLDNDIATTTRPGSDLYVDTETGTLRIRHGQFRAPNGTYTASGPLGIYLAYTALRKDVTPAVDGFNMIRVGSITDLETDYSPIDTQNPLGLGLYLAILNGVGVEMLGIGVDEVSTTEPEGTLDSYLRALEYTESKDVYTVTALTHSIDVGDALDAHVTAMSDPAMRLERVAIFNPERPARKTDTTVASTATANCVGGGVDTVESGIANLQSLLAAIGLPGPTYSESDAVFIEFESDTNKYLIQSISGGQITVNNGVLSASNSFFFDNLGSPVFTDPIVDRPMSVKVRGAVLANRTEEASAYADLGRRYQNRRMIVTAPDTATMTIDGLDTSVPGYYINAAIAGLKASKLPQTPLTEASISGLKAVSGSQDRYSEPQLKIMSAGGLWIMYQESDAGAVLVRQQLTTDMTSAATREDSITQAIDFAAKLFRRSIRNFIGRYNITLSVVESVTFVVEALVRFLTKPGNGSSGVLKEINVLSIQQSTENPDEIEMDAEITPYYPFNKMKIRFII